MIDYSKYTDLELVALLREDSPSVNDVFNIIYLKYSSQVYGYCLYRTASVEEAKELMQESWMKFFRSVKSGKSVDRVLPYLFTIARNICINNYRQRQASSNINLEFVSSIDIEQIADSANFHSEMEKDEIFGIIKIGIRSLKDIYKETLLLYWFGDMKFSEIAVICGENEATVRKRFERAMEQLNVILKPYLV